MLSWHSARQQKEPLFCCFCCSSVEVQSAQKAAHEVLDHIDRLDDSHLSLLGKKACKENLQRENLGKKAS